MSRLLQYLLVISSLCDGSHILFLIMWQSRSHFGSMLPLMNGLLKSGHKIAVYYEVFEPQKLPPNFENYLAVHGTKSLVQSTEDPYFLDAIWNGESRPKSLLVPWTFSAKIHEEVTKNHSHFWRIANKTWDLLVVDSLFSIAGLEMTLRQSTPVVLFHTSVTEFPMAYFRGKSWPMATAPAMFLSHEIDRWTAANFWDRFDSFWRNLEFLLTYFEIERMAQKYSTLGRFSWREFFDKSPLSLSDQPDTISWSLPSTLETVSVGTCPTFSGEPLNKEIETFVSDPESLGTILVALGTLVDYNNVPRDRFEALIEGLSRLKEYRIVWAYKNGPKLDLPSHIMTLEWVPQPQILRHRKTKLFLSHGGLKSLKETICHEVPAVYLPLFSEQMVNSFLAKHLGFGGYLNKKHLTADRLEDELRAVLGDKTAYDNVKRAKRIWTDKIIDPVEHGAFWANKILRGINDDFLKPKSAKLHLWISRNFDIAFLAVAFFLCVTCFLSSD